MIGLCRRPPVPPVPPVGADDRQAPGVRWVRGDVRQPESWLPHLRPGIAVYHLAALRSQHGRRRADFEAVNVTACRELAQSCLQRGAGRFILVTSAHLYGPSAAGVPRREADGPAVARPANPANPVSAGGVSAAALGEYERTRGLGLLAIRQLVGEGLDAVALCPTILFGPDHDAHPNRITSEVRRVVRGGGRFDLLIGDGTAGRDLVYVDDVVDAALTAERVAPTGAELLLGGEAVSHRGLIERTLALAGRPPKPILSIPPTTAMAAARAADRLLRREAGCGYAAAVARVVDEWLFDCGQARQMLGYRPRSLDEGLAATLRWLRGKEGET